MSPINSDFLGKGWSFPPAFNAVTGTVEMVQGETDINQSLQILFSTTIGERIMQPRYGCNLQELQFESSNDAFLSYLKDLIANAILFYEPRIKLDAIQITEPESGDLLEGRLNIRIDYSVNGVNSRFNYVYDFYLNEANQSIT